MVVEFGYNRASISVMIERMLQAMMNDVKKLLRRFRKPETGELCMPCVGGAVVVVLVAIWAIALIVGSGGRGSGEEVAELTQKDIDAIVQHGQVALTEKINAGEDISNGPCLDNAETYENWVIDIAHDPREPVDDEPGNQCSAYRSGKAEHFVELSTFGDIIQISATPGGNEEETDGN